MHFSNTPKTATDIIIEQMTNEIRQKERREAVTATELAYRTQAACDKLTRYGGGVATQELAAVLETLSDLNENLHHRGDALTGRVQIRLIIDLLYALAAAEGFDCIPGL